MRYRRRRLALALGTGVIASGLAGLGLAGAATETAESPEQAALDRFCAGQHPCVIVNGAADPDAGEDQSRLVTAGEALAATGKSPGACPEARAAYARIGIDADAFVGGCPKELPKASPGEEAENRASIAQAMAVEGGPQ